MKPLFLKHTVDRIRRLGYNVIYYNIDGNKSGSILIKNNSITGTVIGIIESNYFIHGITFFNGICHITVEKK